MTPPVYLDYNATTPHDPEVVAAMRPFLETEFGNPSSTHLYGIIARKAVETARGQVAALLGCRPGEIIFTSGGTESINYAITGIARARRGKGNHIITSSIEHPAVLEVCRYLQLEGFRTIYLPVDAYGIVQAAGRVELSHVIQAMNVPANWAQGTLRFSTGRMTSAAEIHRAVRTIADGVRRVKK